MAMIIMEDYGDHAVGDDDDNDDDVVVGILSMNKILFKVCDCPTCLNTMDQRRGVTMSE